MDLAWAYTVVRNEAEMLSWWLTHYGAFCERLIVYDDESDDGTPRIALEYGAEVRPCPWRGLDDLKSVQFASAMMAAEARWHCRWGLWVDADELIVDANADMRTALTDLARRGVRLPAVAGFQMQGTGRSGVPDTHYSKPCVVDPSLHVNWGLGRHSIDAGDYPLESSTLRLLHYRYINRERFIAHSARNWERLTPLAREQGWGSATAPDRREMEADNLERLFEHAEVVI